jgi:hypothetical protein
VRAGDAEKIPRLVSVAGIAALDSQSVPGDIIRESVKAALGGCILEPEVNAGSVDGIDSPTLEVLAVAADHPQSERAVIDAQPGELVL